MSTIALEAPSALPAMFDALAGAFRASLRAIALAALYPIALADAAMVRITTEPTGAHLAHARAAWLHRWSRVVRRVLGLRVTQRGYTPASGIVVADRGSLLDAILLAAVRPCVFVAGAELRRRPIVGHLARLAGTLFVDGARPGELTRALFIIERAVGRRLLVVIFPECGTRGFRSALFQPAAALRCTLTAAAIRRHPDHADIVFGSPRFRTGDRKTLARALREEIATSI